MTTTQGDDDLADILQSSTHTPTSATSTLDAPSQSNPQTDNVVVITDTSTPVILHNDDDASDVSMSADSDESDDETIQEIQPSQPAPLQVIAQPNHAEIWESESAPVEASRKRKFSPSEETSDGQILYAKHEATSKRVRLEPAGDQALKSYYGVDGRLNIDRSLLPAEIWHHIFTFTPPKALGRLLQVNKLFKSYLDYPSSTSSSILTPLTSSVVPLRSPELIWQSSRRLYRPWMPSPLQGYSEIDMWKLSCSSTCQFCDRKQVDSASHVDPWHSGPGENGVRPIWAFAVRACGSCLQQKCIKEIDLLLSSSVPSPLMTALPFIFLTHDFHVITSTSLAQGQPPAEIQFGKYFFKSHVEDIKTEFFKVKSMGSGAAEEWLKGLEDLGKDKRNDIARWERFELTGGLQRLRGDEPAEREMTVTSQISSANGQPHLPELSRPPLSAVLPKVPITSNGNVGAIPGIIPLQLMEQPTPSYAMPPRYNSPAQNPVPVPTPRPFPVQRSERTKEEVAELKAARRAEIERRCLQLDPPLLPAVLAHMGSFQAAIQIITPFDDNAWELLKPRLLSQRAEAEQRENDRIAQTRLIQEKTDENRSQDVSLKESKELVDREWEDVQGPLRARIGGYADEIIRDGWGGGEKVDKDNSPKFAADVLIYVRKRFYAEIAKDDAAARAAGQSPKLDPPNGPFSRKLILENMKWIFDMKIKPHTEQNRKELFLCNGCENNFKFYALEGVIQHYAAKHTSALSVGSVVVHWRAEWPEHPPFNPDPSNVKSSYYTGQATNGSYSSGTSALPQNYGFGGYPAVSGPPVPVHSQPPSYQPSPGPYYGTPQFGDQYPRAQAGSFAPPAPYQGQPGFNGPQYQTSQVNGYQPYPNYQQPGYEVQYQNQNQNPAPLAYDPSHPNQIFPVSATEQPGQNFPPGTNFHPGGPAGTNQRVTGARHTEAYQTQLQDIARSAREIWNNTSGVKEMPGSVRVFVILYHLLQRSRGKYPQDPPLSMLIDGLSNNKDMRVVRNVNGLACRACALEPPGGGPHAYSKGSGVEDKKLFSLPQLFNHFQTTHVGNARTSWNGYGPPPEWDWTRDMIELPEKSKIAGLAEAQGIDEHKLKLIKEAIPEAFRPSPAETSSGPFPAQEEVPQDQAYGQLAPSRDNHEKYYSMPARERSPDAEPLEHPRYESRRTQRFEDYPIIRSSGRNHVEERQVLYQDPPMVKYVERRFASPLIQDRIIDEYGRQIINEPGRLQPERSRQYVSDEQIIRRGQGARSPIVIRYEDHPSSRLEASYQPELSAPRAMTTLDRPPTGDRGDEPYNVHQTNPLPARLDATSRPRSLTGQAGRSQQGSRLDTVEAGSEDGELRADPAPTAEAPADVENAAERFLNNFLSENGDKYTRKAGEAGRRNEDAVRVNWETERVQNMRQVFEGVPETQQPTGLNDQEYPTSGSRQSIHDRSPPTMLSDRRVPSQHAPRPRQVVTYEYDDRPITHTREPLQGRVRSPHLVDHRGTIYREERIGRPGPSNNFEGIARYENVRHEKDRGRSRSPVYTKYGQQTGTYREQSPGSRLAAQEPLYRSRTPQGHLEEYAYERVPRPEYYRVYAEEPRPRHAQYEPQVEYVQVSDPQGDYVIRRPVRREAEPVYATYADEPQPRATVYETRAPVSRSDPAYYEEYDPRHPAPPPQTTVRQVRYQ